MKQLSNVVREGAIVGALGAGGVAAWFFVVDLIAGQPLRTPGLLGRAMMNILEPGVEYSLNFDVAAYTAFHVSAFVLVGLVACTIVDMSRRIPHLTIGLLMFFVVFEVGFYFLTMLLSNIALIGSLAWYQIGAANVVASALMGGYIWRRHPELKTELKLALDGRI